MRVVINAQLDPVRSGGIAQVLLGLAHGLGSLDAPEEYLFVCSPDSAAWLDPHLSKNQCIAVNTKRTPAPPSGPRTSDGFWESFEPDVLHFPYQSYTVTSVPSVFNPHDLQHVHLPEFFSKEEYARRDALYAAACDHAHAVVVASEFVRRDLIQHYHVSSRKVHVVEWGAPTATLARPDDRAVDETLRRLDLNRDYVFYPAQTWPHKNHARLIEAMALLRQHEGVGVALVCSGTQTEHFSTLKKLVRSLDLENNVHFVGRVADSDVRALYAGARMVVVPTLFEAVSFPVYEAFAECVPVACSHVTSLPDQAGDAALLFDPYDVRSIASAIARVCCDTALRRKLVERGSARLARLTWKRTAEQYLAIYRACAGRTGAGTDVTRGIDQQGACSAATVPVPRGVSSTSHGASM